MIDLLVLGLASFLLGSAIAYAWWAKVRVTFLQEELFIVRDNLWDVANELNALSDPAFVDAREYINTRIRMSRILTVSFVRLVDKYARRMAELPGHEIDVAQPLPKPSNPNLARAIAKAKDETVRLMGDYLVYWTARGFIWAYTDAGKQRVTAAFSSALVDNVDNSDRTHRHKSTMLSAGS